MRFDRSEWGHLGERPRPESRPGADPDEQAAEARRYLADQGRPPPSVQWTFWIAHRIARLAGWAWRRLRAGARGA
jgi:hypothetical protein